MEEYEEDFSKKPTLKKAVRLMEIYAHRDPIKNYDKAIYYGKTCIDLGCDTTSSGMFVNLWMAAVYHEMKDDRKACQYLRKALLLDKENRIEKYDYYKQEGLDPGLVQYCQDLK
ncbi:MAG: hypothetical protein SWH78_17735 [Thermodesulfobacteriota bacterium]|nr:hypothetical protein [Thermodesulfobacteriota bacterium]